MLLTTHVLNPDGTTICEFAFTIDAINLMITAEPREETMRAKGAAWTAGGVSFFGQQLVKAVKAQSTKDMEHAVMQMTMAVWLYQSIYGNLDAETFARSDLFYTVAADGTVRHDRVIARPQATTISFVDGGD